MTIDFTKKKFGMISLGCDKNRVDSEKCLSIIKSRGCTVCDELGEVNILIINTCSFLNASRKEAIETIIDCAANKGGSLEKIVVTGCLPQKFIGEIFEPLVEADVFLGTNDYGSLFDALEKSYSGQRVNFVGQGEEIAGTDRVITTPQHYAYLKIADGCNNRCTYCLIPKIRGAYKSTPMEELIEEAENLGDVSELIIVAQDITRYGIDLYGQKKLREILQKLTALVNINSVRLLYSYPDMLDDGLIEEIKKNNKIIKYLDIPLQHSEDRILKLMNRKGTRREYLDLIAKLRREIPEIAIRSTFIAGFPEETEEDFEGLKAFLQEAKLDNCGFFAYSREPDTAAYKLKNQVPYSVKKVRVKELYKIQSQISADKLKTLVGKKINVLCDGIDYQNSRFVGRAYFQAPEIDGVVYFNANTAVQGEQIEITVDRAGEYDLYGHSEDYDG